MSDINDITIDEANIDDYERIVRESIVRVGLRGDAAGRIMEAAREAILLAILDCQVPPIDKSVCGRKRKDK